MAIHEVAVGMPVTRHPPRRSGRALLTHPAPALSLGVEALLRVRMNDPGPRQPVISNSPVALPVQPFPLTPATQGAIPTLSDLVAKSRDGLAVQRHPIIVDVPLDDPLEPRTSARHGVVQSSPEFCADSLELGYSPFPHRFPPDREPAQRVVAAQVRESEEVEALRPALTHRLRVPDRIATEAQ
jgi:hypothetical protein